MAKKPTTSENIPNREELFNMAVQAARQGQRQGARVMFNQLVQQDRRNIRAMMWLAKLAGSEKERTAWLNKVLEIKPDYAPAQEALSKISYDKTAKRNKQLFRLGIGIYVGVVLVLAAIMMISSALQPVV